jgi:membrane fusion protein, multidrug efflux system
VKATFPNRDKSLWPGQFANVTVVLSTIKDAVVVPAESIQQGQQGAYLYVIKPDMTVEMRTVKTGQVLDGEAVVEKGVKGGEKVVTDGQLRLFPGARVEIASGLQPGGSAAPAQAHTG